MITTGRDEQLEKRFRPDTDIPLSGSREILFSKDDCRWHSYYDDCGVLQPFLDVIQIGLKRFVKTYLPQFGYSVEQAMTQVLISGERAIDQRPHGDGDNNFLSAIFCFHDEYPFNFWKGSHNKWLALRLLWEYSRRTFIDPSPTYCSKWTLGTYHMILFSQRLLHAGCANPQLEIHGRAFFVLKPKTKRERPLAKQDQRSADSEYVMLLEPQHERYFSKKIATTKQQRSRRQQKK